MTLLKAGVPREVACAGVGIDSRTLRIWMERARSGEAKFVALESAIELAQSEAQSSMLVRIRKHGDKGWRALAWFLERVWSDRYGYKAQTRVTVEAELERILDLATAVLGSDAAAKLLSAIVGEAGTGETPEASGNVVPMQRAGS